MPQMYEPRNVPWSRIQRWPGRAVCLIGREPALWLVVVLLNIALALTIVLSLFPYASVAGPVVFALQSLPATAWLYFGIARTADTGTFPRFTPALLAVTVIFFIVVLIVGCVIGAGVWASRDLRSGLTDAGSWAFYLDPASMLAVMMPWLIVLLAALVTRPFMLVTLSVSGLPLAQALVVADLARRRNPAATLVLRGVYLAVFALFLFPVLDWMLLLTLPFAVSLTYVAYRDICEHAAENQPRPAGAARPVGATG